MGKELFNTLLKVGKEKHVHVDESTDEYNVCNKNNLCFRNSAEMYRWESWTDWLAHVNKGKNFNLVK